MIVQPEFEQVACIFNSPHPVHDGEVFVTRVDCAVEVTVFGVQSSLALFCHVF